MIPTLLEQLAAARIPSPQAAALRSRTNERKERTADLLVGSNATVRSVAEKMGVDRRTARDYLDSLVADGRAVRWTSGGVMWFGASSAELSGRRSA